MAVTKITMLSLALKESSDARASKPFEQSRNYERSGLPQLPQASAKSRGDWGLLKQGQAETVAIFF